MISPPLILAKFLEKEFQEVSNTSTYTKIRLLTVKDARMLAFSYICLFDLLVSISFITNVSKFPGLTYHLV